MSEKRLAKRPLSIREILAWARAYREATGRWPTVYSGLIAEAPLESWRNVDAALRQGLRGLPRGSSLAQLLVEQCGARNPKEAPPVTLEQVLAWADEHHARTGKWPSSRSGRIPDSGGEKWKALNRALELGLRGLPGGSSLARLLAERRGKTHHLRLPQLALDHILQWADAHFQRTGKWPTCESGTIAEAPDETWKGIARAMFQGNRGLQKGYTLAMLLAERRGVRNLWTRPELSLAQILAWADTFHARTGSWPMATSGAIAEAPGETWKAVALALFRGTRGLSRGQTLAQLLATERGVPNRLDAPRLTRNRILAWADTHHRRTGEWPTRHSGPVHEVPTDTWRKIDDAMREGSRGFRGRSSLALLLARHRGVRNPHGLPLLSKRKIVTWADAHFQRTGTWPTKTSGSVADAPGENWQAINQALRHGFRGLTGGASLKRLLVAKGRLPRKKTAAGDGRD
jgi:hypothetical protein